VEFLQAVILELQSGAAHRGKMRETRPDLQEEMKMLLEFLKFDQQNLRTLPET